MKLKPVPKPRELVELEEELDIESTLPQKIKHFSKSCPFDLKLFYKENKGTVKKFLRKDTFKLEIEQQDPDDVPAHHWYNNQQGILKSGLKKREYSVMQKLEWIKCGVDIIYFTQKYVKIITLDDGIQPFMLYDYQADLLETFIDHRFVIDMQARQSGKSQTVATFIIHYSIYNQAKTSAILAQMAGQAQEIVERIQTSYELIPVFLQPGVKVYNKQTIIFGNKSKIFSAASTSSSVRGKSVNLLFIDECAFINNDMKFYESTYPVIASGKTARVIITSTPNGMRGLFYKLWTESLSGRNDFVHRLVTWDMVPGRDEEWKRVAIANTSEEQFRQEHDCIFRGSSNSLIKGAVLEGLIVKEPISIMQDGDLKVFAEPVEGHEYLMTVDTSRGLGYDYHAFAIIDISEEVHDVAATFKNNELDSLLYPSVIQNAANTYNNAYVLVELNDMGEQVANILYHDLEYENLLTTVKDNGKQVIGFSSDSRKGVTTSAPVKSVGCSNAKTFIENGQIRLNDDGIINEFGTMVPVGRSYSADVGANDDQAMTIVLYSWAMTQPYFVSLANQDARLKLIKGLGEERNDFLLPFGIIDNGVHTPFTGEESLESEFFRIPD